MRTGHRRRRLRTAPHRRLRSGQPGPQAEDPRHRDGVRGSAVATAPGRSRPAGAQRRHRADHRRNRHRQGTGLTLYPQPQPPGRRPVRRRELRRLQRHAGRGRTVRLRKGSLHRCAEDPGRLVRGRPWRHAVAGRDRRPAARPSGQASARVAGARGGARRLAQAHSHRRPRHRRHQRRSGGGGGGQALPRGSVFPFERRLGAAGAAARTAGRHPAAGPAFPRPPQGAARPAGAVAERGGAAPAGPVPLAGQHPPAGECAAQRGAAGARSGDRRGRRPAALRRARPGPGPEPGPGIRCGGAAAPRPRRSGEGAGRPCHRRRRRRPVRAAGAHRGAQRLRTGRRQPDAGGGKPGHDPQRLPHPAGPSRRHRAAAALRCGGTGGGAGFDALRAGPSVPALPAACPACGSADRLSEVRHLQHPEDAGGRGTAAGRPWLPRHLDGVRVRPADDGRARQHAGGVRRDRGGAAGLRPGGRRAAGLCRLRPAGSQRGGAADPP